MIDILGKVSEVEQVIAEHREISGAALNMLYGLMAEREKLMLLQAQITFNLEQLDHQIAKLKGLLSVEV